MTGVVYSNKAMSWKPTPLEDRSDNVGWSDDGIIKIFDTGRTDTFDKYIKNSGLTYIDMVGYVLYYDKKEKMVYLKDIRDNVLYAIPSGAKSKGYMLAYKLNSLHKYLK